MEKESQNKISFKTPSPFFILGSPRSGTTLLRTLFDAHPNVIIPLEYPLIPLFYSKYKNKKPLNINDIREFIADLQKQIKFDFWEIHRWRIDWEQFEHEALSIPAIDFAAICMLVNKSFKSCFEKKEILMIGDKNPIYSNHALLLAKLYPNAKYIHLSRDPRGQIASLQRQRFGNRLTPANAYRWNRQQNLALKCSKMVLSNFIEIKYEDLISMPESTFARLCEFLGLPYFPDAFNYYKQSETYIHTYQVDGLIDDFRSTMHAIDIQKAEEWRKLLKPHEIRIIESLCRKNMRSLGYLRTNRESYWPWLLLIPVWMHIAIQFAISWPIKLLPWSMRTRIILRSSIFEKIYEAVFLIFRKKSKN